MTIIMVIVIAIIFWFISIIITKDNTHIHVVVIENSIWGIEYDGSFYMNHELYKHDHSFERDLRDSLLLGIQKDSINLIVTNGKYSVNAIAYEVTIR